MTIIFWLFTEIYSLYNFGSSSHAIQSRGSGEEKSSNAEIDYIFQYKNNICPVEVKAGKTGTLKSMQMYLYEKKLDNGIRLNMDLPNKGQFKTKVNAPGKNAEITWNLLSLPLYMVSELKRLIDLN